MASPQALAQVRNVVTISDHKDIDCASSRPDVCPQNWGQTNRRVRLIITATVKTTSEKPVMKNRASKNGFIRLVVGMGRVWAKPGTLPTP